MSVSSILKRALLVVLMAAIRLHDRVRRWSRKHRRRFPPMQRTSWRFLKTMFYICHVVPAPVMSEKMPDQPKPLLHSNVAAVSFPTPALNTPITKWTHAFRVMTQCPEDILSWDELLSLKITVNETKTLGVAIRSQCKSAYVTKLINYTCQGLPATQEALEKEYLNLLAMYDSTASEVTQFWGLMGNISCASQDKITREKRDISTAETHKSPGSQTADILVTGITNTGSGVIQIQIQSNGSQHVHQTTQGKGAQRAPDIRIELPTTSNLNSSDWLDVLTRIKQNYGKQTQKEISTLVKLIAKTQDHPGANVTSPSDLARRNILLDQLLAFPPKVLEELCSWRMSLIACWVPTMSNLSRSRRGASLDEDPGVLGWKWSINKMLWGGLNNEDSKLINDRFSEVEGSVDNLRTYVHQIMNASLSASESLNKEYTDNLEAVKTHLRNITLEMGTWAKNVKDQLVQLQGVSKQTDLTLYLVSFEQHLISMISTLSRAYRSLREIRTYYRQLGTMIGQRHISLDVITLTEIRQVLTHVSENLEKPLGVVGYSDPVTLIANIPTSCYLMEKSLVITMEIPLVNIDYKYVTWRVASIPFYVKGRWLQLDTDIKGINIDQTRGIWQGFTAGEMAMCQTNKINVCPFSVSMRDGSVSSCLHSLVTASTESESLCSLKAIPDTMASPLYILPISNNEWLISVGKEPIQGIRRCPDHNKIDVDTTMEFASVTYLQLAPDCSITIGSITLMSIKLPALTSYSHSKPQFSSASGLSEHNNIFSKVTIPLMDNKAPDDLLSPSFSNLTFKGDGGVTTIENLRKYIHNQSSLYLDESDAMGQKNHVRAWMENSMILNWVPSTIANLEYFIWVQIGLDVVVIWSLVKSCLPQGISFSRLVPVMKSGGSDSFGMVSATPLRIGYDSRLLGLPIKAVNSSAESTTLLSMTTISSTPNVSTSQLPMLLSNTTVESKDEAQMERTILDYIQQKVNLGSKVRSLTMDFWVMAGLMILIAIICHLVFEKQVSSIIERALGPLGLPPLNRASAHHAGEIRVILTVVLELFPLIDQYHRKTSESELMTPHQGRSKRRMSKREKVTKETHCVTKQVAFQLCTLPGTCDDWTLTRSGEHYEVMEPTIGYRWFFPFTTRLTWGSLCIREKSNLSATACDTLPSRVNLPIHQITSQINGSTPLLWWKYQIVALTGIMVVGLSDSKILYQAGVEPEGNKIARRTGFSDNEFV